MNTGIIEIIGPPGIGKSTIYKSLCKSWNLQSNWTYPDVLLSSKPHFFELNNWFEYQFRKLLGKKLSREIPVEYGLRFAENNQELANFCWNHLSNTQVYPDKEINKRFRSAFFLFADFCMYQAILESSFTKSCIIQEGFLQKSFFLNDDDQFLSEILSKYLTLLPIPQAIIYIDTPKINVILERLRNRKKIIASQSGKNDYELLRDIKRWQHTLNIILEKLQNYNVSILKIDGERSVAENVARIKEMLEKKLKVSYIN